jgi:enamine deaminase RidA (YjgF/YER057c/UK114 family)
MGNEHRTRVVDGTRWEELAGYSRAVRHGDQIAVSGTTGHRSDGKPPGDTYEQARRALERALAAVSQLGGSPAGVFRSRVYLTPEASWEEAALAHRELLGESAPANTTLHVSSLVGDDLLVEIELDAEVASDAL